MPSSELKNKLTSYYRNHQFAEISKLPHFTLKELRNYEEDKTAKRDCIWYVTKNIATSVNGTFSFSAWHPQNYCQVSTLKKNDIVIYHTDHKGLDEKHIGLYLGNKKVESKFGYGNVYIHPLEAVPLDYGTYISCFTQQIDKTLGTQATLENMGKWISVYGSICSLQIDFSSQFPAERKNKFLEEINTHPCFLQKSGSINLNLETGAWDSSYIYCLKNNFLNTLGNCRILKDFYEDKITNLEQLKVPPASASFSYTLDEISQLLSHTEKRTPNNFLRLKRHPIWSPEFTSTLEEDLANLEQELEDPSISKIF